VTTLPPLLSARQKLARANEHLEGLWAEVETFAASEPYTCRSETNLKGTEQPIRCDYFIDRFTQPPAHWPLLIGDAVHSLRSALDHAAWALMVERKGRTFAEQKMAQIHFPTHDKPSAFRDDFVIKSLPADLRKVLEEVQPYRRERNPHRDGLWVLKELDNQDKHRALSVVVLQPAQAKITTTPALHDGRPVFVEPGPLRPGAKVVAFTATRPFGYLKIDIEFQLEAEVSIQATPRGSAVPLEIGLKELRARTTETLDWIGALF
jgi:hypothetical protein